MRRLGREGRRGTELWSMSSSKSQRRGNPTKDMEKERRLAMCFPRRVLLQTLVAFVGVAWVGAF